MMSWFKCGAEDAGDFDVYFSGTICVWAMVNPDAEKVPRQFLICGTGGPMPDRVGEFIGTVFGGPFVWHVFDNGEK